MDEPLILEATGLTVEYENVRGRDAIAVVKFPDPHPDGDRVLILGSLDDLRDVVDSMNKLLDDLADES